MGFDRESARAALIASDGDVAEAVAALVGVF
jgi:NACalpha-BTF3-like transcription factor